MLFRSFESIKQEDYHGIPVRGIVVDNDDPLYLGRVKCEVTGRWPIGEYEKLPWIFPFNPYGLGGKITNSSFSVPEIESELIIIFPYKLEYAPFYIGYFQSTVTHQAVLFDEDYPDSYGFCDPQMFWTKVNKKQEYLELFHYCGLTVRMFDDGNVHINIPKNLIINIEEDFLVKVKGKEVWEIDKTSSKIVTEDKVLKVLGTNNLFVQGDYSRTITGNFDTTMLANYVYTLAGNKSVDIDGDYNKVVSGKHNVLVSDAYNIVAESNYFLYAIDNVHFMIDGNFYTQANNIYASASINYAIQSEIFSLENEIYTAFSAEAYYEASPSIVESSTPVYPVIEATLPETSDYAVVEDSSLPLDPIGHGDLETRLLELELKVEELFTINEVMKILEVVLKEDRLKMTSLGAGEFIMKEVK